MAHVGDAVLDWRQILKIADSIFETITWFSHEETDTLSHEECANRLVFEPLVRKVALNKLFGTLPETSRKGICLQKRAIALNDISSTVTGTSASVGKNILLCQDEGHDQPVLSTVNLSMLEHSSGPSGSYVSTDISSVVLTPVTRLPVRDTIEMRGAQCLQEV